MNKALTKFPEVKIEFERARTPDNKSTDESFRSSTEKLPVLPKRLPIRRTGNASTSKGTITKNISKRKACTTKKGSSDKNQQNIQKKDSKKSGANVYTDALKKGLSEALDENDLVS